MCVCVRVCACVCVCVCLASIFRSSFDDGHMQLPQIKQGKSQAPVDNGRMQLPQIRKRQYPGTFTIDGVNKLSTFQDL